VNTAGRSQERPKQGSFVFSRIPPTLLSCLNHPLVSGKRSRVSMAGVVAAMGISAVSVIAATTPQPATASSLAAPIPVAAVTGTRSAPGISVDAKNAEAQPGTATRSAGAPANLPVLARPIPVGSVHAASASGGSASVEHAAPIPTGPVRDAAPAPHAAPAHRAAAARKAAPAKNAAPARKAAPARPDTAAAKRVPAARHAVSARAARPAPKPAAPARPYLVYDSVTPSEIPAHQQVATYANGRYQAAESAVRGRGQVLWIDTNGSDPSASALDVEPGDATPTGAGQWVKEKLSAQPNGVAIVYTMRSEWQGVKDAIGSLPPSMQSKVRYWIADPTGVPHNVTGASATQWYWGSSYDISTANPGF
jgi:hypothetical protein